VDDFEPVAGDVVAGEPLDRIFRDPIGCDRTIGMLLVDRGALEDAIGLLGAEVDRAFDAEEAHRLEDVERTLDVDAEGADRARQRW
jgi:hypothetical protein